MAEWWSTVDRTFLFLLTLPFAVAGAGYLRYRWDERREKRRQSLTAGSALFLFWLLLSGSTEPFLVGAGAASAGVVVWVGHRMAVIDREGHPIHLGAAAVTYWPWLLKEIVRSAWDVSKIIVNPRLPVSPTIVRVAASQRTAVGVVTFANSITLTPGTISMEVGDGSIVVHALTAEGAASLAEGGMDRRVTRFGGAA
jgi:multicomponent Na+:H+ antiporter subunit E